MLVFPQLTTVASTLYPLKKRAVRRTAMNVAEDGTIFALADPAASAMTWELRLSGMTLAEWKAIDALFQSSEGMCQTFTFLDPTANLLAYSENFAAPIWSNNGLIELTSSVDDPAGTARAMRLTNAGQAPQELMQALNVPGTFGYCLSVWARTAGNSSVTLKMSTSGGDLAKTFGLTGSWMRISLSGSPGQNAGPVSFGVALDPGATVDLFGMQAEAQLGSSDYKITTDRSGVYSKARFGSDQISVTAQGLDSYDAVIEIVDTEG